MQESSPCIIFHAGLPKTGSTFLQRRVFPRIVDGRYLLAKRGFAETLGELSIHRGTPLLVSDERLTWTPLRQTDQLRRRREATLASLARAWPGQRLLLFLREPASMIRSHYAQYLHDGGSYRFDDFFREYVHTEAFRFELLLQAVSTQAWGQVLLFEHAQLRADPDLVVRGIEAFCGVRFEGWQGIDRSEANTAIGGWAAVILRRINALVLARYPATRVPLRARRLRGVIRRALQFGPLDFLNRRGAPLISDERMAALSAQHAASWSTVQASILASQEAGSAVDESSTAVGAQA